MNNFNCFLVSENVNLLLITDWPVPKFVIVILFTGNYLVFSCVQLYLIMDQLQVEICLMCGFPQGDCPVRRPAAQHRST